LDKNNKTYVLDTSVLIEDPDVFYKLGDGDIVLSTAVIKEIDGLKKNPDDVRAKAARKVARTLDRIGSYGDISRGARTFTGSRVMITPEYTEIDALASNADNRIVGTAVRLQKEAGNEVILVSTDGNMRNVTRSYGITAENYPPGLNEANDKPMPTFHQGQRPAPLQIRNVAREHWERERIYKAAARQEDRELPKAIILFTVLFMVILILIMTVRH
jgi:predicted ribonuclease YlaK